MPVLNLGKVRITFGGSWDKNKDYELLTIVYSAYGVKYISKQNVPTGTQLSDDAYWEPISGYFVEQYQGPKSEDPTERNDGNALQVGDLYFNTANKEMRVYNSDGWVSLSALLNGGQIDGDLSFVKEIEGIILIDRSDTTKKYRLFIDNGNLGIEEV